MVSRSRPETPSGVLRRASEPCELPGAHFGSRLGGPGGALGLHFDPRGTTLGWILDLLEAPFMPLRAFERCIVDEFLKMCCKDASKVVGAPFRSARNNLHFKKNK